MLSAYSIVKYNSTIGSIIIGLPLTSSIFGVMVSILCYNNNNTLDTYQLSNTLYPVVIGESTMLFIFGTWRYLPNNVKLHQLTNYNKINNYVLY